MTEDGLMRDLREAIKECLRLSVKIAPNRSIAGSACKRTDIGDIYFGYSLCTLHQAEFSIAWDNGNFQSWQVNTPLRFMCHKTNEDGYLSLVWNKSDVKPIEFDKKHNDLLKRMIDIYPEVVYPILRLPEILRNIIDE